MVGVRHASCEPGAGENDLRAFYTDAPRTWYNNVAESARRRAERGNQFNGAHSGQCRIGDSLTEPVS